MNYPDIADVDSGILEIQEPISCFENLQCWQMARKLCQFIHEASNTGTFTKDYALRDQISRASGSSMDNIAEGFDAGYNAEFIRFLGYAHRSCSEVQSQLYRALDRTHITTQKFDELYEQAAHTRSKIGALIRYLKNNKR
jgi:four helix bundle protein